MPLHVWCPTSMLFCMYLKESTDNNLQQCYSYFSVYTKCAGRKIILQTTRELGSYYKCATLVLILIGALAITNWYIEYELPTLVRGLQCNGSESTVLSCSMNNDGSCRTSSDASVICPGTYTFNYTGILCSLDLQLL